MTIVFLKKLQDFDRKHANARNYLSDWKRRVAKAQWKKKQDVLDEFPNAHMIKNNRARFKIMYNTFRLIAEIDYEDHMNSKHLKYEIAHLFPSSRPPCLRAPHQT